MTTILLLIMLTLRPATRPKWSLARGNRVVPSAWRTTTLLRSASQDEALRAAERLTQLFRDPTDMRPLGRAYLASRGDRPSERALLAELLPPEMGHEVVVSSSDGELRDAIRRWASDDLTAGRVEEVGGWLLSRSEVRLAALVAMMSTPTMWY